MEVPSTSQSTGWKLIIQDTHINSNLGDDAWLYREARQKKKA